MIHQYKLNGYNIVLDCPTGSIHLVDDVAYDIIAVVDRQLNVDKSISEPREVVVEDIIADMKHAYPELSEDAVIEAFGEVCELYDSETLFTKDIFAADVDRFSRMPTVIKAACLNVSHDCNLACKYCFAGEGEYHGERELMSEEVGKKALEFLVENSGLRKNLEVDFFGGEPLMNFEVVKKLVAYGRELEKNSDKHFRFTLTTNAVLLNDEVAEFADKELDNVVLSLDGRQCVHDQMRPLRGGGGSYERVVKKIQEFVKKRGEKKHYIRGTFTSGNLDFSKDILHMAKLGFKEISMEPVVAPDSEEYAIKNKDVPRLLEEYESLACEMAKRQSSDDEFNFFHFMIDLTGGPCVYKRLSGCGAGSEYVAITPNGDIYPCHQFVGLDDFVIGNVFSGIKNTKLMDSFKGINVYTKEECKSCFANMYCSGGCMANAYNSTGKVDGVYEIGCELERKRVECAIMLEANRRIKNNYSLKSERNGKE